MKIYSLLVIFFVSLLICIPAQPTKSCGPDLSFSGYSFLMPNIVDLDSEWAPYYFQFQNVYNYYDSAQLLQTKSNLEEWQEIFCQQVEIKDLEQIIYRSEVPALKRLRTAVQNEKYPLDPRWRRNSFALHLKANRCLETVNYLIFAKECEPYVVSPDDRWAAPGRDANKMQTLIEKGEKAFRKTRSNYIRLRYAYQLIRLAHYRKDYEQTLALHDRLLPRTDSIESIINDWILGHKAGAMMRLGQNVEASYLFSLIFARRPEKRHSAFKSFYVKTDEEWTACLLMCQDDHERANLYALRAGTSTAKVVEEMIKIYELDSQNAILELLLAREIKKLERDLLGLEFNDRKRENKMFHNLPRKGAPRELIALQEFVIRLVEEGRVRQPQLWQIARGYLEFLAGDDYAARQTFALIKPQIINETLKTQLATFELALWIDNLEDIDNETEEEISDIITDHPMYARFKDFPDFLNDRLAHAYREQGDVGKAFRCQYNLKHLLPNPDLAIINNLLEICRKEDKTRFEEALVTDRDGNSLENDLLDAKGTYYLARGQMETALEVFRLLPREAWDKYKLNPFIEQLNDCLDCPLLRDTIEYNKVTMIQRIFELEYRAKADFQHGAEYYYELGKAYYNITYFGHSWYVADFFRSGANWYYDKDNVYSDYYAPLGNLENHDCSRARAYFERAAAVAETAKNYELAARATFMAAKCEHNDYYLSKEYKWAGPNQIPKFPAAYQRNFQLLRDRYAPTAFYQEAIAECKYFEAFTRY